MEGIARWVADLEQDQQILRCVLLQRCILGKHRPPQRLLISKSTREEDAEIQQVHADVLQSADRRQHSRPMPVLQSLCQDCGGIASVRREGGGFW